MKNNSLTGKGKWKMWSWINFCCFIELYNNYYGTKPKEEVGTEGETPTASNLKEVAGGVS